MLKRNKPVESQRRKKISLPAAIFNRSPHRSSENSSLISNNTSISREPVCENHSNKKGKYTVISEDLEEEEIYYCEKCAILLASRGFEVKKLEPITERKTDRVKGSRDEELNQFIETLEEKISILNNNLEQSSSQVENLDNVFEEKAIRAQQFFDTVAEIVEKHKRRYMESMEMKKKYMEDDINSEIIYIKEKIQLLETMKDDIITSQESIVKDTPEEDYQLVMGHYRQNVDQIKYDLAGVEQQDNELPSAEAVEGALCELIGVSCSTLFSFDSQQ